MPVTPTRSGRTGGLGTCALAGVLAVALAVASGCTDVGEPDPPPEAEPTASDPMRRDGGSVSEVALAREPAPRTTVVTHVWGRWPDREAAARTRRLAVTAGRAAHVWIDRGFVSADYPTSDFARPFATFTRGAAARAADQGWLTTNRSLGGRLVDVVALRRTVRLVAFAPRGSAVGATANVTVALLGLDASGRRSETGVSGRLSLTRGPGGGWQVFGYDLRRSVAGRG